jgi:magnesium transporter
LLSADPAELSQAAAPLRSADIVDALNKMPTEASMRIVANLPFDLAVEVLEAPEFEYRYVVVEQMDPALAGALVAGLSSDAQVELLRELPQKKRNQILRFVDERERRELHTLLEYEESTAGGFMTTDFVSIPSTATVGEAIDRARAAARAKEIVYAIYVVDARSGALLRVVSLQELLLGGHNDPVTSVGDPRPPLSVMPDTDQEEVARIITKYNLLAIPVVDDYRRVLGIVTVDDVIDAITRETTEDVQKFGGMEALDEPYLRIGFLEMIKKRAGWLAILFVSEMLTATAMQYFNDELSKALVLAMFIPLVMSSGGNSGSQATSLIIRALALREVTVRDWWRVALRELPSGFVLGAILGVMGFTRIVLWQHLHLVGPDVYGQHYLLIATTIGFSLVGIVTFGSLTGSMLPFVLRRLGFDPASASAPFVATLVDVTGITIYFSVAYLILHGTLL